LPLLVRPLSALSKTTGGALCLVGDPVDLHLIKEAPRRIALRVARVYRGKHAIQRCGMSGKGDELYCSAWLLERSVG
jgi:hypothetical protein